MISAMCLPPHVKYRQADGFILHLMCPGDLLGSDDYHVPAMFWFEYAQGTLLCYLPSEHLTDGNPKGFFSPLCYLPAITVCLSTAFTM